MSVSDLTAGEIITKFELQVNDVTELSSSEELDLLNDKIQDLAAERPWETLKKTATGALILDAVTGLYYITIPTDFGAFSENNMNTDNTLEVSNNASPKVIFVGILYTPYQIVNYNDRLQYRTQGKVCYYDMTAGKIYFTVAPPDTSFYQFDYVMVPPLMTTTSDTPDWIPNRFRTMLAYIMAVDDSILQLSANAAGSEQKNMAKYQDKLSRFNFWNDSLNLN